MKLLLAICLLSQVVDYPIVYIGTPRYGDGTQVGDKRIKVAEVHTWTTFEAGSNLYVREPNGTRKLLLPAGPKGAITDPKTYDGDWVFFAWTKDVALLGTDIYKLKVSTGELVQLTFGEFTPNTGVANWLSDPTKGDYPNPRGLATPIYNQGPQPLPNGRVMFTSSRNGYVPTHVSTEAVNAQQLYVMDDDGKNVEQVGFLNLGSALHPTLLKDGRVMWASAETQGHRNGHHWSIWASKPDGRTWEPLFFNAEAGGAPASSHFQSQWSDGDIAFIRYYLSNNWGFGALYGIPSGVPTQPTVGGSVWGHPKASLNPPLSTQYRHFYPFQRLGMWAATPWTIDGDIPAPNNIGKVSMPSGAPDNKMLLCYSPGPVSNTGNIPTPWLQSKIVLMDKVTKGPEDFTVLAEDTDTNFLQPIALVPWERIYGQPAPEIEECPYIADKLLPRGSPFGLVGTSTVFKRESATENENSAWIGQGTGPEFDSGLVKYIRIYVQEPNSWHREYPYYTSTGLERLRVVGDVKVNADGSFLAIVPADTPFTFGLIAEDGTQLTYAQTWHQVRPGEKRVDCNGCHAHHEPAGKFEDSLANLTTSPVADLTMVTPWTVEWKRDVWPTLEAKCNSCHSGATPAGSLVIDESFGRSGHTTLANAYVFGYSARSSRIYTKAKEGHGGLTSAELLKLAQWIDIGCQRDLPAIGQPGRALQDDSRPTLFLDSPRRKELSPVSVIRFGAHDYYSGVASVSVKATVPINGVAANQEIGHLFSVTKSVWTLILNQPLSGKAQITVVAKDKTGNQQKIVRDFTISSAPPVVNAPKGVYYGFDGDHLGDLRSLTPDSKLDHHIRLEGLRHPVSHIEIKAGSGTTDFKWSNRAGEESPEFPQGKWWYIVQSPRIPGSPVGVMNLRFSEPTPGTPHTDFRVYVMYSDTEGDYDLIRPTSASTEVTVLKAKLDAARAAAEQLNTALAP
jgi:hypothetical protein